MTMKSQHLVLIMTVAVGLFVAESIPGWFSADVDSSNSAAAGDSSQDEATDPLLDESIEAVYAPIDFMDDPSESPVAKSNGDVEPFWMQQDRQRRRSR